MQDQSLSRWLIGGPARCGKSALAGLLARQNGPLATMRVDALLHLYRETGSFRSDVEAADFLRSYLKRPRFMDTQKETTLCPLDDFPDDLDQVVAKVAPRAGMRRLETIGAAFDIMARSRSKKGWAVLDLHPEVHFRIYSESIPDMKLLVCLRDPLEAVTASLYWRDFPDRCAGANRRLRYLSALWRLAASAALSLRKTFPDRVFIASSNDMFEGKDVLPRELNVAPDAFSRLFNGPAYFSARKAKEMVEFFGPDGRWHKLLDGHEIAAVERWRSAWWRPELFAAHGAGTSIPGGALSVAAERYPSQCKAALDMTYSPVTVLRRRASGIRSMLRKSG